MTDRILGYRSLGPFFKIRGMAGARAFGWQIDITDHRVMPPFFSERYGYGSERYRHIGPFCVRSGRLISAPMTPKGGE